MMEKIKAVILRNELDDDHKLWVKACEDYKNDLDYRIVDITASDWLEAIQEEPCNILLAKPGGLTALFKQLYDEKIFILAYILGFRIFPSPMKYLYMRTNVFYLTGWKLTGFPIPLLFYFMIRKKLWILYPVQHSLSLPRQT